MTIGVLTVCHTPDGNEKLQAMLPWWRTIAPAQVRHTVVAAAEAVDCKAETLPAPIIEAILALCPRSLTRAVHRRQHLDQIERALAG